MATIMTHALVPLAVAAIAGRQHVSPKLCFWAVIASLLPDADVVAFKLGIAYEHILGHRGFTHSLGFALAVGLMASFFAGYLQARRWVVCGLMTISCLSHPLLDALTDGGLGVALWWPLDDARYFAPWQPIAVSPIGIKNFITARGWAVLQSELVTVWLPLALFVVPAVLVRKWNKLNTRRPSHEME